MSRAETSENTPLLQVKKHTKYVFLQGADTCLHVSRSKYLMRLLSAQNMDDDQEREQQAIST